MNRFLILPLGVLLVASSAKAQSVNIPLPPPTPLGGTDAASGTPSSSDPGMAPVTRKAAAQFSDAELHDLGTGVAFPYELLDGVLKRYVDKRGDIYYLKAKGDNDLDIFARAVAIVDLKQFPVFSSPVSLTDPAKGTVPDRTAELAFWINAYNGLRIKAIADRYPDLSTRVFKTLDTTKNQTVAGRAYSFAELRQKIGAMDPRALFALMSGTKDGPSAPIGAFRFFGLNRQLDQSVQVFVSDLNKVAAPDRLTNSVEVSPFLAEVDAYFKPNKSSRRKSEGVRRVLSTYSARNGSRSYFATNEYTINFSLANSKLNEQLGR